MMHPLGKMEPVLSKALSPNTAKRGIPKELRVERAFHDTLPESPLSLRPSRGTSQGRDSVWLFSNPCWFPFMNLLVPLEPTWTSWIHHRPWQRVGEHNDMLCGFVWTFYLNLLSARTIWCFCTDSQQWIPRHSFQNTVMEKNIAENKLECWVLKELVMGACLHSELQVLYKKIFMFQFQTGFLYETNVTSPGYFTWDYMWNFYALGVERFALKL